MRALTRALVDIETSLPHFQWIERVSSFLIRETHHPEVNIKILPSAFQSKTWALWTWVGSWKALWSNSITTLLMLLYSTGVTKLSTPKERYDSDRKLAHWPSRRADSKNCHTCSDYLLESSPDFRAGRKKIEVSVPFSWKPLFANLDMSVRFINFYFVWRAKFITKISTSGATISRHNSGDAIFRILSPYIYIHMYIHLDVCIYSCFPSLFDTRWVRSRSEGTIFVKQWKNLNSTNFSNSGIVSRKVDANFCCHVAALDSST